jgi:ATP-binding cassette subfamily B protein
VRFEQVTFRYAGSRRDAALRSVSFEARPGELIAVVGPTGAGKSSLVNLIPRLYDVSDGAVLVDDHDVRELRSDDLRRHVAVVLQDSVLFSGTIADNLRFGRPDATDDEVVEAARMAQAHDFITEFAEGYDTLVGQRGVNLSGGQKQRLAIARALATRPAILILDGCTSALDAATEARLFTALREWSHDCTRFVVTHRLGPVLAADQILVLEDGELLAAGRHADLMERCPHYREVVETQITGWAVTHG